MASCSSDASVPPATSTSAASSVTIVAVSFSGTTTTAASSNTSISSSTLVNTKCSSGGGVMLVGQPLVATPQIKIVTSGGGGGHSSKKSASPALLAIDANAAYGSPALSIGVANLDSGRKSVGSTKWMPLVPKEQNEDNPAKIEVDKKQTFEVCVVCGDKASGRHYGAISCEGCKGFFKRSIRKMLGYSCRGNKDCEVTKHHRNRCQYCRLQKCLNMGMRSDSVQSERKPLDSAREKYKGHGYVMGNGSSCISPNQKIYIRKDLRNPLTSASGYMSDKNRTAAILNAQLLENMANMPNTDLSTLASVVTTLANMGKRVDGGREGSGGGREGGSGGSGGVDTQSNESGEMSDGGGVEDSMCGGDTNGSYDSKERSLISAAFDTMAKVVQAQSLHVQNACTSDGLALSVGHDSDTLFEIDGPLLLECQVPFRLHAPSPMPTYLNVHYICESASRLLFLSVHWARSIPAFQLLEPEAQVTLVRGCWCELFALGLAQCSQVMSLTTILTAIISHLQSSVEQEKLTPLRVKQVSDHICKLQDYVTSMLRLQVDEHEYAYLKAVALFASDNPALTNPRQVEKFQDKAYRELRDYIGQTFPDNHDRFPKLLLRLPTLRSLQPDIIEELFFAGLIGNVQIDNIIPYILRMETNEYASNMDNLSPRHSCDSPDSPPDIKPQI